MQLDKLTMYCEECERKTVHHYYKGHLGGHWEPDEPEGLTCDECETFTRGAPDDGVPF